MNEARAREFVANSHRGVLSTAKKDGRPQMSIVAYAVHSDGRVRISSTQDRAKTRNLRRDPRASLLVTSDDWSQYVVVEGNAEIDDGPEVLSRLQELYRQIRGEEHPDWEEF